MTEMQKEKRKKIITTIEYTEYQQILQHKKNQQNNANRKLAALI